MEILKQFFTEDNNRMSLMRLMCFICLLNAIVLCYLPSGTIASVSMWLGVAFGSKLIQKPMEKENKDEQPK